MLGLLFGVLACLLWGTSYVVPLLLSSFSPDEILLGRYLAFGVVALVLRSRSGALPNIKTVFLLALLGYLCYDFLDILNIRIHTPETVALLYGTMLLLTPLVMNFLSKKELPSPEETLQVLFFLVGLIFLEWGEWSGLDHSMIGCVITLAQGGLWAFYTRAFSQYEVTQTRSVIIWVGIFCFFLSLGGWGYHLQFKPEFFSSHSISDWVKFILVSLVSGIGYCWLASHLWCRASKMIHYNLLNTLLLGDVVAGRLYGCLTTEILLSPIHWVGMFTVLTAGLPWKKILFKLSRLY